MIETLQSSWQLILGAAAVAYLIGASRGGAKPAPAADEAPGPPPTVPAPSTPWKVAGAHYDELVNPLADAGEAEAVEALETVVWPAIGRMVHKQSKEQSVAKG